MVGIRTEVSNLSTVLDQKEITIATVTEKTAHLEKQLKTEQENRDHISAEYWVSKTVYSRNTLMDRLMVNQN